MARYRHTIEALDEPLEVFVTDTGEPDHRKVVAANTGYTFETVTGATVDVRNIDPKDVDDTNQRPTPADKPHAGQTSTTSSLQPEPVEVTSRRDPSQGFSDIGGNADAAGAKSTEGALPVDRDTGGLYSDEQP